MDTPVLDHPAIDRTNDLDGTLARITARFHEIMDGAFVSHLRPTITPPEMTDEQVNLLQQALDYITCNPEEHDQRTWGYRKPSGRAVGCLGFHVARIAGRVESVEMYGVRTVDRGVYGSATKVLGLNESQAMRLFAPQLSINELWQRANEFSGGRIKRPVSV